MSLFTALLLLSATVLAPARATKLSPPLEKEVSPLCTCDMFIQSEKSSGLIRLPSGLQSSLSTSVNSTTDNGCLQTCEQKFPLSNGSFWILVTKRACKAILADGESDPTTPKRIRGLVQAYYRPPNHTWKPMGSAYRRILSCKASPDTSNDRAKRSLTKNARKISNSKFNSIDAQSVVTGSGASNPGGIASSPEGTVSSPDDGNEGAEDKTTESPSSDDEEKRPVLLDMAPLQMALKRFDVLAPYVDALFGKTEPINVRDLLDRFRMGGIVDRYYHAYDNFADEVDAARCTFEYFIYSVINHRLFSGNSGDSGDSGLLSRGFQDDAMHALKDIAVSFLRSDNSSDVIRDVWNLMPVRQDQNSLNEPSESNVVPDVKDVAMTIGRFYLRSYLDNLGSTKSSDPSLTSDSASSAQQLSNKIDSVDTPDSLADMVEQVSKPFFLSIFGVVPGLPASGRLDRRLLDLDDDDNDDFGSHSTENRIKLEPTHDALSVNHFVPAKTGNIFFDAGNTFFGTFQRANDATHSLFCAKQYMVNKVWERFRITVRKLMRSIPVMGSSSRM